MNMYDVVIVGGGPAGLTAALYLARARYSVLVIEKETFGGQITITSEVVNYPGVLSTSGKELTETMRIQAENFGAEFMLADVSSMDLKSDVKVIKTSKGEVKSFGVVLAMGAHPRKIGFKGEAEFKGRGVAYCATCDGEFFTGKEVFVIGGGFAAAEESVFLTRYAKHVTILIREEDFTCAKSVADEARENENITILTQVEVQEVSGDSSLDTLVYKNLKTGELVTYKADAGDTFGVFVFAGYEPENSLIKDVITLNEHGYVETDKEQKTNLDGVYAAGDICVKNLRQVVTAVGDGAIAATELEKYVQFTAKKTGIKTKDNEKISISHAKAETKKEATSSNSGELFDDSIKAQLNTVFSRMINKLQARLYLDDRGVSDELKAYIETMASLTDKVEVIIESNHSEKAPCVKFYKDGQFTGLAFHGVPGGHEFNSFVLGIYNAAGPGQPIDEEIKAKIQAMDRKIDMTILVSLSCTMCPDLVLAAQRIASLNSNITAEVYDINHFPELKDKYNVMSVPCLVVNDDKVIFGKKNIAELVELI